MEKDLDKILYNTCVIIFLFSLMSLLKQLGVLRAIVDMYSSPSLLTNLETRLEQAQDLT